MRSSLKVAGGLCLALFVLAFVAAPFSCEGGLEAYFAAGILMALVLGALPFTPWFKPPSWGALLQSLMYIAVVTAVWFAGLLIANVRIMCRLF